MSDSHQHREQGVEFGDVAAALERHEFPVSAEGLIEAHGDRELGVAGDTTKLRDVLAPADGTYASPAAARRAIVGLVGDDAVGRGGYTDRDPPTEGEASHSPASF